MMTLLPCHGLLGNPIIVLILKRGKFNVAVHVDKSHLINFDLDQLLIANVSIVVIVAINLFSFILHYRITHNL